MFSLTICDFSASFQYFFYCLVLFFGDFAHPRFYLLKLIPPLNRSLSHIHVFLLCFMTHWFELGLTVSAKDWRDFLDPAELSLGYTTKTITVFPPKPSGGNISAGGIIGTYIPLPKLLTGPDLCRFSAGHSAVLRLSLQNLVIHCRKYFVALYLVHIVYSFLFSSL